MRVASLYASQTPRPPAPQNAVVVRQAPVVSGPPESATQVELSDQAVKMQRHLSEAGADHAASSCPTCSQTRAQAAPASTSSPTADSTAAKSTEIAEPSRSATENLTESDKQEIAELKRRDSEVRAHEQAHMAAAGSLATGGPAYEYEVGPDGKRYAVGGHVSIDTSSVGGDAQATLAKAQQIVRAANAPASPSQQDQRVAAKANAMAAKARREIAQEDSDSSANESKRSLAAPAGLASQRYRTAFESAL